jgi:Protein of unknown function (DUF3261)
VRSCLTLLLAALVGCATPPAPAPLPELRVAPAAYGQPLQLAQRLHVEEAPEQGEAVERSLDAVLEVDASQLRLAALALGQRVLGLQWDGVELQVQRHPLLPAAVDPARVLRDIALVHAPLDALRATLPAGWQLLEEGAERRLIDPAGRQRLSVRREAGQARIDNPSERYRLRIESRPL